MKQKEIKLKHEIKCECGNLNHPCLIDGHINMIYCERCHTWGRADGAKLKHVGGNRE